MNYEVFWFCSNTKLSRQSKFDKTVDHIAWKNTLKSCNKIGLLFSLPPLNDKKWFSKNETRKKLLRFLVIRAW